MPLVLSGSSGVQDNSGAFVAGTAVASTSGTSIDFTSIPSWAKRVTIVISNMSTNGSSNYLVQVGTSSGVTTSGYNSIFWVGASSATRSTTGFIVSVSNASFGFDGVITLVNLTGNSWNSTGIMNIPAVDNVGYQSVGRVSLGAALDRVRITTVNGTDTFDAGSINILFE